MDDVKILQHLHGFIFLAIRKKYISYNERYETMVYGARLIEEGFESLRGLSFLHRKLYTSYNEVKL